MKWIDRNHPVLLSEEFLKDKTRFALIVQNLESESVQLCSDGANYLLCRGKTGWPIWVWTKDQIDPGMVQEVESAMEQYLTGEGKEKFTCKKEFYELLVRNGYEKLRPGDYFEMGSLTCKKTKKPRPCEGAASKPDMTDKPTIARYWYADAQEMNAAAPVSLEEAEEDAQAFVESGTFFVWKNHGGKIVSMVSYRETGGCARLSHVYTPVEERKKGYAANLIYSVTNMLLSKGLVPLLYTDYHYIPSNKAYKNAGYEDTGVLINFYMEK